MFSLEASTRGNVIDKLRARAAAWSGAKVSRKIVVPPELSWWYWQEYGTATRRVPNPGPPFDIKPVDKKVLAFPSDGGFVFKSSVDDHPGINPQYIVRDSLEEIKKKASSELREVVGKGGLDTPTVVGEALERALEFGIEKIAERMDERIPGSRPPEGEWGGGRLKGDTASAVFRQGARVVSGEEE